VTFPLRIPAERFDPPPDLLLNAGETREWLESLRPLRTAEAGHQVLANLSALNRSRLAFADRLALLETYRPAIERLFDGFEAEFGIAGLPPTATAQEALALCRDLAMELGYGYKILIVDPPGMLRPEMLPVLVLRAMGALAQLLRSAYLTYTGVPEGTWLELHRLYALAEEAGISEVAVEDGQSAQGAYTELLLVSLTDPYRLNPGEVTRIPHLIRAEPGLVRLARTEPNIPPAGQFIVESDFDRPPSPILGDDTRPLEANRRSLDAAPLVERLRAQREALRASHDNAAPATRKNAAAQLELLQRLLVCWGSPPRRLEGREPSDLQVGICVGLPTLTYLIGIESEPSSLSAPATPGAQALQSAAPHDPISLWQVLNRSYGGLRLARAAGPLPHPVAVGEVVGIQFPGRGRWAVGVVRWLRRLDNGGTEFGLQYLGNAAINVEMAPITGEDADISSLPFQALVLDGEVTGAQPTLLATPGVFAELRAFQIGSRGAFYRVRALSLIEQGGAFELFRARRA
jgi:hypothetical protein